MVPDAGWRFSDPVEMQRQIDHGLVVFRDDHTEPPFRKAHLRPLPGEFDDGEESDGEGEEAELAMQVRGSYFYKQSQVAVRHLRDLTGGKVFNNPKDHVELARLFEYVLDGRDGIVLDFFAGSGSTAEAVFELCARTGQNCPVVLVQLPEKLEDNLKSAKGSAKTTIANAIKFTHELGVPATIAELTKQRLRLAGAKALQVDHSLQWARDVGFRVLRIDTSNLADVLRSPDDTVQAKLSLYTDRIGADRTDEDLLFQVLIDWGLDLALPVTTQRLDGQEVYVVDDGALVACFANTVTSDLVSAIAKREPLRAVFRDSAFENDAARVNAEQVFAEKSPGTDVKAI